MSGQRAGRAPPPATGGDGDGVRIWRKPRDAAPVFWICAASVVLVVLVAAAVWSLSSSRARGGDAARTTAPHPQRATTDAGPATTAPAPRSQPTAVADDGVPGRDDPDDLAAWIEPGDPEPTAAEVIGALHDAGIRSGIGAFNPPGTSPPLQGLAVPDGFDLPAGYVRHHQVTDGGVPLEPILMFSPDFVLRDARGRIVELPADRVVPPAYAPPGMPLRQARIPPP